MTYSQAKVQGQWSVGSEDGMETNGRTDADGRTDGGDCITSHANAVGKKYTLLHLGHCMRCNAYRKEFQHF